jgi:hypothetical protein
MHGVDPVSSAPSVGASAGQKGREHGPARTGRGPSRFHELNQAGREKPPLRGVGVQGCRGVATRGRVAEPAVSVTREQTFHAREGGVTGADGSGGLHPCARKRSLLPGPLWFQVPGSHVERSS